MYRCQLTNKNSSCIWIALWYWIRFVKKKTGSCVLDGITHSSIHCFYLDWMKMKKKNTLKCQCIGLVRWIKLMWRFMSNGEYGVRCFLHEHSFDVFFSSSTSSACFGFTYFIWICLINDKPEQYRNEFVFCVNVKWSSMKSFFKFHWNQKKKIIQDQ